MVNRVQTNRFSGPGNRPANGVRAPGELYVNFTDMQLGVIDENKDINDLIAVRFFSVNTPYNTGDVVWEGGHLWHANQPVPAGPFNPAYWDQNTTSGTGGYVPITGGTMTGALILASDPISPLGAVTKQYSDLKMSTTGGTFTGSVNMSAGNFSVAAGNISASGSGTFGSISTATANITSTLTTSKIVSSSGGIESHGSTSSGFFSYDRGNSGGNTADYVGMYRDGNIGRLSMEEFGDVLQMSSTGTATFLGPLTVTGATVLNSSLSVAGNATVTGNLGVSGYESAGYFVAQGSNAIFETYDRAGTGQALGLYRANNQGNIWMSDVGNMIVLTTTINMQVATYVNSTLSVSGTSNFSSTVSINHSSGANYPLYLYEPSNQHCVIVYTVNGVREWLGGCFNNGYYYLYDGSAGQTRFTIDTAGNTNLCPGNSCQTMTGAAGYWDISGKVLIGPGGSGQGAGGALSVYGGITWSTNIKSRVDTTGAYLAYWTYGNGAVGWITTDGGNTYYSTACDVKLKDNVRNLVDELNVGELIDKLHPVAFEWKPRSFNTPDLIDEEGKVTQKSSEVRFEGFTDHGFVAQELYEVVPHIVQKGVDKPNEYGVGDTWGADYSKLIPYLVAEIQSLRARLAKVEGK